MKVTLLAQKGNPVLGFRFEFNVKREKLRYKFIKNSEQFLYQ